MDTFKKYEFNSQEQYNELKTTLVEDSFNTFVELGTLVENKYSVDVLWNNTEPEEWLEYEINDVIGNGAHTFLGYDYTIKNI